MTQGLTEMLQQWDEAAWCLAALAIVAGAEPADPRRPAAAAVLRAAGVLDENGGLAIPAGSTPHQLAAQAAAPLIQVAAAVQGNTAGWMALPDEALVAQGEASGQMAPAFSQYLLPALEDLSGRLTRNGARMLDVGTGIGAIATGFAELFEHLHVTGIDVAPRVLALARHRLATRPVADRVELREQRISDLDEVDTYDLAWVPAPFVPQPALGRGLMRVATALRPGGWLLLGHGKLSYEAPLQQSLTRFKSISYGGTAFDDEDAAAALAAVGLTQLRHLATPPGAPAITAARRQ
jgi:SAM-dependent methyltransferase